MYNDVSLFVHIGKNERDLVVLYHNIGVLWPGNRYEKKSITLVSYGEANGYTAMAKTVGIPTAIAASMILQGKLLFSIASCTVALVNIIRNKINKRLLYCRR